MTKSPWERALGSRFADLEPSLRTYFQAIPPGFEGRGSGTFDTVGTPRRWLWPLLAVLGRAGILFPVWERDVPFTIVNRPRAGGLRARRTFGFRAGQRVMADEITTNERGLIDALGRRGRIEVALSAEAVDGRLELRSRGAALRLGRLRIPVPCPRVVLLERSDPVAGQHVSFTMDLPLVGRVYEYAGAFRYEVVKA